MILEKHGGKTPRTREDLEALPGVGHKTASVVLNEVYGEATIAVDTHVFRVVEPDGPRARDDAGEGREAAAGGDAGQIQARARITG